MNNEIVKSQPSLLTQMAQNYSVEPTKFHKMLKATAFAKCRTDEEFMAMCVVANTYHLNPLLKEIYAFPSKDGAIIPIVGIDGWARIINEHPMFDGCEFIEDQDSCTCIIYRKDRTHPVKVTEWMCECNTTNTQPWGSHPRRMLRHRALIQTARLAFGFAGIYDADEAREEQSILLNEQKGTSERTSASLLDKIAKADEKLSSDKIEDIVLPTEPADEIDYSDEIESLIAMSRPEEN